MWNECEYIELIENQHVYLIWIQKQTVKKLNRKIQPKENYEKQKKPN